MDKKKIVEAIGLLNSMVACGESHTRTSSIIVKEAVEELKKPEKVVEPNKEILEDAIKFVSELMMGSHIPSRYELQNLLDGLTSMIKLDEYKEDTVPKSSQEKTLDISEAKGARANISDINIWGDVDAFALLCKASSESQGWMKSTKVCNVPGGCIVQVTTQQRNPDKSYAVAEALTFVPRVHMDRDSNPRKLVSELSCMATPQNTGEMIADAKKAVSGGDINMSPEIHNAIAEQVAKNLSDKNSESIAKMIGGMRR